VPPVPEIPPLPELPPVPETPPLPELPPVPETPPLPALAPLPAAPPVPAAPLVPEKPPVPEEPPLAELPPDPPFSVPPARVLSELEQPNRQATAKTPAPTRTNRVELMGESEQFTPKRVSRHPDNGIEP